MKTQDSARILTGLAPVAMALPPIAVGALVGLGLLWFLSDKQEKPEQEHTSDSVESAQPPPRAHAGTTTRKVTREDLAEALAYGEKAFTRKAAVEALETLGFRKTAAYKALATDGKFASMLIFSPDGLIEWNG